MSLEERIAEIVRIAVREELARALPALAPASDVLSTSQAAKLAGVTRKTVNDWIASGKLGAGRRGKRRAVRREDLDRYLAGERDAAGATVTQLAAGLRR